MPLKLKNPLAIFDLETTGTSIANDRIIELSFVKLSVSGEKEVKTMRINPEMPIPYESSVVHGIYDEDVKDAPTFKSVAKNLGKWLEGCDLGGFNAIKFDVPILVEEFLRADVDFEVTNRRMIDAQRIFHMMEKRTLSAAYQFYCGKELVGAHGAEADTLATLEVLEAQVERYDGQDVTDNLGNKIGVISNDMDKLHELTFNKLVDLAGRLSYNSKDEIIFKFGKHKDKLVTEVFKQEPSYYDWMMNAEFPLDTKRKLTEIRLKEMRM